MFTVLKNTLTDEEIIFKNKTIFQEQNLDAIRDWVENNLSKFNVSEAHSCIVERVFKEITISGDEDRIVLELSHIMEHAIIIE